MQGHHPLEGREEGCVMWITSPSFGGIEKTHVTDYFNGTYQKISD